MCVCARLCVGGWGGFSRRVYVFRHIFPRHESEGPLSSMLVLCSGLILGEWLEAERGSYPAPVPGDTQTSRSESTSPADTTYLPVSVPTATTDPEG